MTPLVDVSHHQGHIDFARMHAVGIRDVIVRVGDGGFTDRQFTTYVPAARAAGIRLGTYLFCRLNKDPQQQARDWKRALDTVGGPWPLGHWADLEVAHGTRDHMRAWLHAHLAETDRLLGGITGIYSGASWWNTHIALPTYGDRPLWMARYRWDRQRPPLDPVEWEAWSVGRWSPPCPTGWDRWTIWQFSSAAPGAHYGASSTYLDVNVSRLTTEDQPMSTDQPPLVAGHDGKGRWWRAVAGGDMVEVTETDARALVAATPGAKIVGHDLIEFLLRVNAPINLAGKVERR